ncbi:DUF2460 domain-containing protein [Lysobacter sp. F6437]|uniref:DUF2460 domain-containing protein n=1 Tax=Lysobacter sp. F6437 TaxID=3459296 RepID=UPI00403D673D
MTFYATEIDTCPAYGWQGGPEFDTRIKALRNGHERRNGNWDQVRHRYTLPMQNKAATDYLSFVKSAHLAMRGQLHSFLVKDYSDFEVTAEPLGLAPAGTTAVQLVKLSTFGLATYERVITKPLATVVVYEAGVAKAGTLDTLTGLFTPTEAWVEGAALTWSGEFRIPVRFAQDYLPFSIDNRFADGRYAMNGSIELIEVFGE